MRCFSKIELDTPKSNAAIADGTLAAKIHAILEDMKPEAVYFAPQNGKRTALIFHDIPDSSHLPRLAEPWFLLFDAHIESTPVMTPEDLAKATPDIEAVVKKFC